MIFKNITTQIQSARADDHDTQEPELKVLRKGFGKVLTADEIIKTLK